MRMSYRRPRRSSRSRPVPILGSSKKYGGQSTNTFYDPTFHGQDWTAVGQSIGPWRPPSDDERAAVINRMLSELGASHTGYYTASDPAYYQLLDIFSGALRQPLRRLFPDGQVSYPGIGIFTKSLWQDVY